MTKSKKWYQTREIRAAVIGGFFAILATLLGYYLYQKPNDSADQIAAGLTAEQKGKIKSSVVYIECPMKNSEFVFFEEHITETAGEKLLLNLGSGVLINPEGRVLTNAHIFFEDEEGENYGVHEKGCFVQLSDPQFGTLSEIYIGEPVLIPEISDEYDLAFLDIYDVYTDPDNDTHGYYPKVFAFYDIDQHECKKEMELGYPIQVLGYPTSSNNVLTITEGKISAFEDYHYLTTAEIDAGNSGGLSFDKDGCFTGTPYVIDQTNLGAIMYPAHVKEFLERAELAKGKFNPKQKK